MKNLLFYLLISTGIFASCSSPDNPFGEPRKINWKQEWIKNESKLKSLVSRIRKNPKKFETGNNNFPEGFEYPFDDGFYINWRMENGYPTKINPDSLTILFYVDRGLMDHYSAIIFTNDSLSMEEYESNIVNGGNDYKIEQHWYMIND